MKQIDFNKAMVGRFYMQDLVNKDMLKKLKNRGEGKDEKSVRQKIQGIL